MKKSKKNKKPIKIVIKTLLIILFFMMLLASVGMFIHAHEIIGNPCGKGFGFILAGILLFFFGYIGFCLTVFKEDIANTILDFSFLISIVVGSLCGVGYLIYLGVSYLFKF